MHLLEMAKTVWNTMVTMSGGCNNDAEREWRQDCQLYLSSSLEILSKFGPEGDIDQWGPLDEIQALQNLLDKERQ
jgi:hypothetical protein